MGCSTFKERWLSDVRFKSWLKEHPKDKHKAICKLSNNKDFLSRIGSFSLSIAKTILVL